MDRAGLNETTVKHELRLNEWSSQIKAQQESGLTVKRWCCENSISPNTYYQPRTLGKPVPCKEHLLDTAFDNHDTFRIRLSAHTAADNAYQCIHDQRIRTDDTEAHSAKAAGEG